MGFSIGSLLSSVGSVLGGAIGGFPGAIVGAVSRAFLPTPQPSFPGPTVQPVLDQFGALSRLGGMGTAAITVTELLKLSRERTGRPASSRKIRESARVCGIALTAQTFALTESQICTIIISTGRRRARGISAADLRRTRSTLRKVHNIQHDLRALAPTARRPAHHHHRRS